MKKSTISIIKKLTCTTFCALLLSANFALIALADDPPTAAEPAPRACETPTPQQTTSLNQLNSRYSQIISTLPKGDDNKPILERPISLLTNDSWEESENSDRNRYCQSIQYLQEYINLAKLESIADCRALAITTNQRNAINDTRCTSLVCHPSANSTVYYNNSAEAAALKRTNNKRCSLSDDTQAQCFYNLPTYINHCLECKNLIEQYIQQVSRGIESPTVTLAATLNDQEVDCKRYSNVGSCSTAFDCTSSGTPTIQTYDGRMPFSTEFFDINDPDRGFGSVQRSQFVANTEGGGLAYTINTIANFLARMIATLALLVFVIGSFILITANGDENQINRGKDAIKYSILGIIIVMLAYIIVVLVQSIFF